MIRAAAGLLGAALLVAACRPGLATAFPSAGTADPALPVAAGSAAPAEGDLGERSSEGGAIAVKASWASSEPPVLTVTLDTHSVELDRFDLATAASLRVDGGEWLAPTAADVPRGGHHRSGTVTFGAVPAVVFGSAWLIELRILDVGVPERLLRWERAR